MMPAARAIHFICVNYEGSTHSREFLESLARQAGVGDVRVEAVVVDNASSSSDLEALRAHVAVAPFARLVRLEENRGYFGGLNAGLGAISRGSDDLVVVGNNDLSFAPDFAARLLAARYAPDVLVVAPDVVSADGYHQNPHVVERFTPMRRLLLRLYFRSWTLARLMAAASRRRRGKVGRQNPLAGTPGYIHMGIGACYVLTPAFLDHHPRLDDSVFLYGEEALLAGQVMSAGGRTYYDADLRVLHAESATVDRLPSKAVWEHGRKSFPAYERYL